MLIFPTVVIGLELIYGRSYAELIALGTASFVAFGVFSLPAGWLADRWSRRNMMALFYVGCGVSLAARRWRRTSIVLAVALTALGMFAAIYHPVGTAMLIEQATSRGRSLAFNGVCGNLGVALAAGITAALVAWFRLARRPFWCRRDLHRDRGRLSAARSGRSPQGRGPHHRGRRSARRLDGGDDLRPVHRDRALVPASSSTSRRSRCRRSWTSGWAPSVSLLLVGGLATLIFMCGALAQLAVGRLVERFPLHILFAVIALACSSSAWCGAPMRPGRMLIVALAVAMAAIYAQVTVNDLVIARYTAGRLARPRLCGALFPHLPGVGRGGVRRSRFCMAAAASTSCSASTAVIALGFVVATAAIAVLVNGVEKERTRAVAPAE